MALWYLLRNSLHILTIRLRLHHGGIPMFTLCCQPQVDAAHCRR